MIAALKRWPGWVVLVALVIALVSYGAARDHGPQTADERVTAIAERVACPNCDGESAAESRDSSSVNIRNVIRDYVDEGQLSDQQILRELELSYGGDILLVPKATGFDALVWALPVAAMVVAVGALVLTFLRWRDEAAADGGPSAEDRALVSAALADDDLDARES